MLAAVLLAAAGSAMPLAVWPVEAGPAMTVVDDVEVYTADPEEPYAILAVQALSVPLSRGDAAALKRLAALTKKLGAEAVVLLGEMRESEIPDDPAAPLPVSGRVAAAAFIVFEPCEQCPEGDARAAVPARLPGGGAQQPVMATRPGLDMTR